MERMYVNALREVTSFSKYWHSLNGNPLSKPVGSFKFTCYSVRYLRQQVLKVSVVNLARC